MGVLNHVGLSWRHWNDGMAPRLLTLKHPTQHSHVSSAFFPMIILLWSVGRALNIKAHFLHNLFLSSVTSYHHHLVIRVIRKKKLVKNKKADSTCLGMKHKETDCLKVQYISSKNISFKKILSWVMDDWISFVCLGVHVLKLQQKYVPTNPQLPATVCSTHWLSDSWKIWYHLLIWNYSIHYVSGITFYKRGKWSGIMVLSTHWGSTQYCET